MVNVPLRDLYSIADTVAGMMHDLDNGKRKYLDIDISNIHVITERWAVDETLLGVVATPTTGAACAGVSLCSRKHGQAGPDRPMTSRRSQMIDRTQNQRRSPAPPSIRRTRT